MPFVKLDCGIIHSSLWAEDSDTKICWITLLLLADATGFVRAAASAIAREAGISADVARRALDLFQGPDDESRTPDNQGKRVEKVDGGYRVLNYEKYRERDYTNAERQKRFRERKKSPMIDRIIERDGQRCGICASEIELADIHIDHIVPLSRGGEDISENRQLAHQECNQRKSSTSDKSLWRNSVMPLCRYVTRYITPRNTCRSRVQKQKEEEGANGSRPQSVEDWLKELEADKTYSGIDVRREYGKMLTWCNVRRKQSTKRRFVNWLNQADKPLPAQHASRADYKRNYVEPPQAPEITDEQRKRILEIAAEEKAKLRKQLSK